MEFDPCYSETIYTSITPYVEFILNSRPKKFLFIVDAVLVFWLLFFAFLKRLNQNLCAESLKFCMRQWPPYCLHLFKLENVRLTFFKFRLTARACADRDSVPLSLNGLSQASCFTNSWFSLTWWDGHVGVQNNGKMSLKFSIMIESNSQKNFCAIVLYTNMAAVTSRENQELRRLQIILNHNKSNQIKFKFWFLVRGENWSILGRNPPEQSREPTKSTHVWRREQNRTRAT